MDKSLENLLQFSVQVYGNLERFSETISKARCRIFYKGLNRNGTYITEEFAEKLIKTLPYAPVKGIYDSMLGDYEDHGESRTLGRIYGVVPETFNFAWEDHEDEDGVVRTYATSDVLLYTALYSEAEQIVKKAESMELYGPSIKGKWSEIDGNKCFVFEEGCFLGLQVLGQESEPCFEGAQFYSLKSELTQLLEELRTYNLNSQQTIGGKQQMPKFLFKLSDSQKYEALFAALNPNFTEEGGWEATKSICEVFDNYAVVIDYTDGKYYRAYYTKNDENDTVTLGDLTECYIVDVTSEEYKTLKAVQAINGGTYEKLDETLNTANATVDELTSKCEANEAKIAEQDGLLNTLNEEKATLASENEAVKAENATLVGEVNSLREYKKAAEDAKKEAVFTKYSKKLSEDTLKTYRDKVEDYDVESLDRELAYVLVQSDSSIFSLDTDKEEKEKMIPTGDQLTGLALVLSKYKK